MSSMVDVTFSASSPTDPTCHAIERLESRALLSAGLPLSGSRTDIVGTTVGASAIFAGGQQNDPSGALVPSRAVDIYDGVLHAWSTAQLPFGIASGAATHLGNRALLFHGRASNRVQIYDMRSKKWFVRTLPVSADWHIAITAGGKAIIGGTLKDGKTVVLAISNFDGSAWRILKAPASLTPEFPAAAAAGQAVFIDRDIRLGADVYDVQSGRWFSLPLPASIIGFTPFLSVKSTATVGNVAVFVDGNGTIALFDGIARTWSTYARPRQEDGETAIAVGTKLFLAASARDWSNVSILEIPTLNLTSATLSVGRIDTAGASAGSQAIIAGGQLALLGAPTLPTTDATDVFIDPDPSYVLSGGLAGTIGQRDKVTVINTGDADLSAGYTIQLYATADRTLNGAILVGSLNVQSALAAGASSSPFSVRSVIPKGAPGGTYHLLAAVQDSTGHITPIAAEDAVFKVRGAGSHPSASRASATPVAAARSLFARTRLQLSER